MSSESSRLVLDLQAFDLLGRLREEMNEEMVEQTDPRRSRLAAAFAMLIKFCISLPVSRNLLKSTLSPNPAAAPVANMNETTCTSISQFHA